MYVFNMFPETSKEGMGRGGGGYNRKVFETYSPKNVQGKGAPLPDKWCLGQKGLWMTNALIELDPRRLSVDYN